MTVRFGEAEPDLGSPGSSHRSTLFDGGSARGRIDDPYAATVFELGWGRRRGSSPAPLLNDIFLLLVAPTNLQLGREFLGLVPVSVLFENLNQPDVRARVR